MNKSNRKNRNRGRKLSAWNVLHELPTFIPPHEPVHVDVLAAEAGDTPRIEGNVTLAIGYRFMDDHYEPFAHKRLTQGFLDRVYRLAHFALAEGLEYIELDDRIEWNVSTGRGRPQRLRIASDHFYWTAMFYEAGIELSTAPVLFCDLEDRLPHIPSGGSGVLFIAIDDQEDQADVLAELTPATCKEPVLPIPVTDHPMTKTNSLLVTLRTSYPHLVFAVVNKANTAYVDDDRYADQLIGLDTGDFLIVDPFESTCGRFAVDPDASYGLPEAAANEILKHNCTPAETSSTPSP